MKIGAWCGATLTLYNFYWLAIAKPIQFKANIYLSRLLLPAFLLPASLTNTPTVMITLTLAQIAQYRSALSGNERALLVLDMIEDCEGNLEDAAISIALQVGQEPDRSDHWLDGLSKRWRTILCQHHLRSTLESTDFATALALFTEQSTLPLKLAVPVLIYVIETGIDGFCQPLQEQLSPSASTH